MSALLHVLHLTIPLRRKELPTLRGWATLGARRRNCLPTRWNWVLETMAGNAFSTRTGSALSLAFTPPNQSPRVRLVGEDLVDAGLAPELSSGAGDALVVEGAGDVQ